MKRHTWVYFLLFVTALAGGIAAGTYEHLTSKSLVGSYLRSRVLGDPEFRYLYSDRDNSMRYEAFTYQSLDGEIKYADDCIGCKEQVGDTHVLHSFVSSEESSEIYCRYLQSPVGAQESHEIIDQSVVYDENNQAIGKRALTVLFVDGKPVMANLFWTENGDLWSITSFDQRHVIAFERSQWFKRIKPPRKLE